MGKGARARPDLNGAPQTGAVHQQPEQVTAAKAAGSIQAPGAASLIPRSAVMAHLEDPVQRRQGLLPGIMAFHPVAVGHPHPGTHFRLRQQVHQHVNHLCGIIGHQPAGISGRVSPSMAIWVATTGLAIAMASSTLFWIPPGNAQRRQGHRRMLYIGRTSGTRPVTRIPGRCARRRTRGSGLPPTISSWLLG